MKILNQNNDQRAEKQWEKSNISYLNHQNYISKKRNKFDLTFIDLLYVSNFKGGNATINELEDDINLKLKHYSYLFLKIEKRFEKSKLSDLSIQEIEELHMFIDEICNLCKLKSAYKIDGFSVSRLSALLNIYFDELIPILDRRILINLDLVKQKDRDTQDQIKNIQCFFKPLIIKVAALSRKSSKSIRDLDKEFFKIKIEKN